MNQSMSPVWVLAKKEFRGFVTGPTFFIVLAMMTTVMTWMYPIHLRMFRDMADNAMFSMGAPSQQFNIHYGLFLRHLSYVNLLLILIVPALTMRLFAEEKKLRTFDLLLTSPVSSWQIVLGKYFAALGVLFLLLLAAFMYPAATALFADVQWGPLLAAFGGIFLVAAVYAAMDVFCSSLTESAIIAFVMAIILNVSIWFVGVGVEVVDSSWARAMFEHISLNSHLSAMVEGTIRSSSLIFFLSAAFFFCFLAERVVESSRWR